MKEAVRFGVSMSSALLKSFDKLLAKMGYGSRSEAIRDMIRSRLVEEEWKAADSETVGTITLVYNHEVRELTENLTSFQHQYCKQIISTMHVHLDKHNCLEVLIVRGKTSEVKKISNRLISTRGVKHGKLTMTTMGKKLA
jgi:CopG family nickel-responsive transcriptional regulator